MAAQKQILLITGAGIAGPTLSLTILAHPLLSALYTPVLLDRLPATPTATGAAVILSPNALHPLFQLGLEPAILAHSQEALSVTMWRSKSPATAPGRRLNAITNPAFAPDLATGLRAIERSTLSRLLLEQVVAHGGEVVWGAKVAAYEQTPEGVEVLLEDGSRRAGHMLVGADGGWSAVRKQLMGGRGGADWKPVFAGASAVYGISRLPEEEEEGADAAGHGHAVLLDVGGVATWALPGGRVFWSVSVPEDAPPEGKAVTEVEGEYGVVNTGGYSLESTEEILKRYESLWFPVVGDCGAFFKNSERIVRAPLWQRVYGEKDIADAGNVVLIGDAARIMVPTTGQGACMSIEDATVLANALLNNASTAAPELKPSYSAALAEYVHERLPRSTAIGRQAWWMGVAFMARSWWWRCVRDWVVRWVPMDRKGGKGACAKGVVSVGAGAGAGAGEGAEVKEKAAGPGAGGWLHGVRLGVEVREIGKCGI